MEKHKIMIIDDNSSIRHLVKSALFQEYEIIEAESSERALELIASRTPDLILLDIMLPALSGLEFCAYLKNQKQFEHIPIVGLSAKTGTQARSMAYELGFSNYIEKPFELTELKSIIKSTLKISNRDTEKIFKFYELSLSAEKRLFMINEEITHLTPKEFDIIKILMRSPETIITKELLLNEIEFNNLEANDRNIDNFISSIRKKLHKSSVTLKTHYSLGYQLIRIEAA